MTQNRNIIANQGEHYTTCNIHRKFRQYNFYIQLLLKYLFLLIITTTLNYSCRSCWQWRLRAEYITNSNHISIFSNNNNKAMIRTKFIGSSENVTKKGYYKLQFEERYLI